MPVTNIENIVKRGRKTIEELKNNKTPAADQITNELINNGKEVLTQSLTNLFNKTLAQEYIPIQWKKVDIILLHKKGNATNLNNYRRIKLISCIYKIFATIIQK